MKRYSREFLLSLADSENCRRPPNDLDPAVSRDSPSPEIVDCGVSSGPKFLHRRDRDYNHDLPEWRSRNSVNGGGLLSQQGPARRKNYDEDGPHGTSFSSLYPSNLRSNAGRGAGQGRWDIRNSIDRERERGGRHWDGPAPEHDGLLGSGGGLRGAYPGGGNRGPERGSDRLVGGGRGSRNNGNDTRLNKFSGAFRNDSDALDGETFGEKSFTEDREEEERQRRESFESMRKELKDERKRQEEKKREDETRESRMPTPNTKQESRPSVPPGFSHKLKEQKVEEAKQEKADETTLPQPSKQPSDVVDPLAIACSSMSLTEEAVLKSEPEVSKFNTTSSSAPVFSTPKAERVDATLVRTSSKFAHLFSFEDENSTTGFMSLFGSGAALKDPPLAVQTKQSSEVPQQGLILPMPVGPSLEDIEKGFSNVVESNVSQAHGSANTTQTFLTCEDIEQSLLNEAKSEKHNGQWSRFDNRDWKPAVNKEEDTNASRQLLSLLQKSSMKSENDSKPPPAESQSKELQESKDGTETKSATLEEVFGMSFMMELLSTDAPLSAKVAAEAANQNLMNNTAISDYQGRSSSSTSEVNGTNHQNWPATSTLTPEVENNFAEHLADIGNPLPATDRSQPKEELDSSVLNDFLKFKKAMKHRNKVNDSFLGTSEKTFVANDQSKNYASDTCNNGSATVGPPGPPANLYRSHSPPLINQKSSSLQLQQLQQVLASQSSLQQVLASQPSRSSKPQQPPPQHLVNGDVSPAYARVRAAAAFSRQQQQQQQQQAMFDQAHLHQFHQSFLPPQTTSSSFHDHHHLYSSKQQQQQQRPHAPSYFPPNGSNQQQTLANLNFPAMSYGHHPAIAAAAGGFVGFPPPNDAAAAFLGGDLPGLAGGGGGGGGGGLDNRWINRGDHHHHHVGLYQQQQHQPMYVSEGCPRCIRWERRVSNRWRTARLWSRIFVRNSTTAGPLPTQQCV